MGPLPTYEPSGSSCTDQFTGDLAGGVDRLRVVIGYGDLRFSASSTPPTPMVSLTLDGQDAMPGGTVVSARDVDPTVFVATFPAPARMVNGMSITVHVMQGFDRGPVGSARPSSSQSNAHAGVGHEVRRESDAIAVPIVRARHLCPFLVASAPLGALRCSHSIGGGLYVGYHESAANTKREAAAEHARVLGRRITYDEVLNAEIGGILGDHLLRDPLLRDKNVMRAKFAADASMKLWGCNSGVSGWVYTDVNSTTHTFVSDQNADADYYYWRALNTRNVPKPSVAQALADYFGITVYGAGSGSHIEVQQGGAWITSNKYKKETGRWPGAPQTLRLHPDRGTYNPFKPTF